MRASLALLALAGAAALYSKGDGVIELDDSSFSKSACRGGGGGGRGRGGD